MGFYYFSLFSWMAFAAYFAVMALLIIKVCEKNKLSSRWKVALLAVAFIAPWTEELWIAYEFGQFCRKDAGKFIYKTVEVEGYYNGSGASLELVRSGTYRFIESPDQHRSGFSRLTAGDHEFMQAAIEKYKQENRRTDVSMQDYIRVNMDDRTEALVYPKQGVSWRRTKIDKPTARYHFTRDPYGVRVGHAINRQESRVTDSVSGEVLGRYVAYSRGAYWFFISLSAPRMGCDGPEPGPHTKYSSGIYDQVLLPKK